MATLYIIYPNSKYFASNLRCHVISSVNKYFGVSLSTHTFKHDHNKEAVKLFFKGSLVVVFFPTNKNIFTVFLHYKDNTCSWNNTKKYKNKYLNFYHPVIITSSILVTIFPNVSLLRTWIHFWTLFYKTYFFPSVGQDYFLCG